MPLAIARDGSGRRAQDSRATRVWCGLAGAVPPRPAGSSNWAIGAHSPHPPQLGPDQNKTTTILQCVRDACSLKLVRRPGPGRSRHSMAKAGQGAGPIAQQGSREGSFGQQSPSGNPRLVPRAWPLAVQVWSCTRMWGAVVAIAGVSIALALGRHVLDTWGSEPGSRGPPEKQANLPPPDPNMKKSPGKWMPWNLAFVRLWTWMAREGLGAGLRPELPLLPTLQMACGELPCTRVGQHPRSLKPPKRQHENNWPAFAPKPSVAGGE